MQVKKTDRGTERQMYKYRYRQTEIKDIQTYTDKQTDRRTVQKCWNRLNNRHMYRKTNIHTYCKYLRPTVLYIRQTHRQTNSQDRQKIMTNRPTNRKTDSI
jgi:hypothetical protein